MGRKRSKGRNRNVRQLARSRTRSQEMPAEVRAAGATGSAFRRRRTDEPR